MSSKFKSKPISNTPAKQDTFDVKTNLKKLNNNSRQDSQSNYKYLDTETTESNLISSNNYSTGFEQTTYQEFKEMNNKIHTNFSSLKEDIHNTKSIFDTKISNDISEAKKDFENKLNSKVDEKLFYGAIAVIVAIVSIISVLSYFPMIEDIKTLKSNSQSINDSIKKVHQRLDKIQLQKLETSKTPK